MKNPSPTTLTASQARSQLYRLFDEAAKSHEPITNNPPERALLKVKKR